MALLGDVIESGKMNIPRGDSFPCEGDIFYCYNLIKAEAITDGPELIVIFSIPYSSADSTLDLYQIQKYPVFDHSSGDILK